ncbi:MAG: GYF domain-containing protein, partial [Polyangiaceae bacterium]
MRFNCQNCGAKYQIADEKVAGKTVRMKCRKCGTVIQVRARPTEAGIVPSYVGPLPAPATGSQPPAAEREFAPRVAPVPVATGSQPDEPTVVMSKPLTDMLKASGSTLGPGATPPGSNDAATEWFVGLGGEPVGPVPKSYLASEFESGRVRADSLVWCEGMGDWKPLGSVGALADIARASSPGSVPPAKVSAPVALTRVKPTSAPAPPRAAPVGPFWSAVPVARMFDRIQNLVLSSFITVCRSKQNTEAMNTF